MPEVITITKLIYYPNKFISNLIKQNESVLQKETGKYSPSLETIPEDSISKFITGNSTFLNRTFCKTRKFIQ
ncbi:hypothetical protein [Rickettsia conorii]|uniref:Uncharacterized protein n=1 Tax=Rickettsia conorii (strain ATCC VR-613 / Malish 7) TaxID=272944 RepID=Q92IA2_RICCN|nr:hypothetical protein [Rickettsia conorii]AAL03056.1 unknown [Rickettsia conorii str. Malish 7]